MRPIGACPQCGSWLAAKHALAFLTLGLMPSRHRGTLRPAVPPDEVTALYNRMPPWLESALLPFQREGVRFGLERGGRQLLADEMGVGKTVQARCRHCS